MSIFITNLAFIHGRLIQNSKVAILTASVTASVAGLLVLFGAKKAEAPENRQKALHPGI